MSKHTSSVVRDARDIYALMDDANFQRVNCNITEANFPTLRPAADVENMLTLTQKDLGGQNMTTAEIEAAIKRQGYRPASIAELLHYAKAAWNGKDWVIALGSSWATPDDIRRVPYIYNVLGVGRELCLCWDGPMIRWGECEVFLVVRM